MDFATAPAAKKKVTRASSPARCGIPAAPPPARVCAPRPPLLRCRAPRRATPRRRPRGTSQPRATIRWTTTAGSRNRAPCGCETRNAFMFFFFGRLPSAARRERAPLAARPNSTSAATCSPGAAGAGTPRRRSERSRCARRRRRRRPGIRRLGSGPPRDPSPSGSVESEPRAPAAARRALAASASAAVASIACARRGVLGGSPPPRGARHDVRALYARRELQTQVLLPAAVASVVSDGAAPALARARAAASAAAGGCRGGAAAAPESPSARNDVTLNSQTRRVSTRAS